MDKLAVIQADETLKEIERIEKEVENLVVHFKSLNGETEKFNKLMKTGSPRDFAEGMKIMPKLMDGYNAISEKTLKLEQQAIKVSREKSMALAAEERAKQASIRTENLELLQKQKLESATKKEQKAAEQLSSAYEQLNRKHIEARKTAMDAAVTYGITSEQFKESARLANEYDTRLKKVDAALGKFNRNVGNYQGGMFGLNNSMAQIMREMPAFTNSAQTGFMAISNNLPILADAISHVRQQNAQLKAEFLEAAASAKAMAIAEAQAAGASEAVALAKGKEAEAMVMANYQASKAPSIWKQLASSLFSWQTLMSVVITLTIMHSKEIAEWVGQIFKSNNALKAAAQAQEDINAAKKEAIKDAAKEISQIEIIYKNMTNEALSREKRLNAAQKMQDLYPTIFGNMSKEDMLLGKSILQYQKLRDAILDSARARAIQDRLAKKEGEFLDKENELKKNAQTYLVKAWTAKDSYETSVGGGGLAGGLGGRVMTAAEQKSLYKESYNKEMQKLKTLYKQKETESAFYLKELERLNNKNVQLYEASKNKNLTTSNSITPKSVTDSNSKFSSSKLTSEQRDWLMKLEVERDKELAINEKKYTDGLIKEKEYLNKSLELNIDFFNRKIIYLKGKNAKEASEEAKAELEKSKLIKETRDKIYKLDYAENEEAYKKELVQLEANSKKIADAEYYSSEDRVKDQLAADDALISASHAYWTKQIELAKNANQDVLEVERKRDEDIGKYQEARDAHAKSYAKAVTDDINQQAEFAKTLYGLTFEQQKAAILANKKLSIEQQNYQLSILEKENQIKINEREIQRLKSLREQLVVKMQIAQMEGKGNDKIYRDQIAEIDKNIMNLENTNTGIKIDLKSQVSVEIAGVRDILSNAFEQMGFGNLANQISERFGKIFNDLKQGIIDWKDISVVAASAVDDVVSQSVEDSKNRQIAALEEQLNASRQTTEQEIGFIGERIEWLNSLGELSKEQADERAALEDEARVLKEQQLQREKMIAAQKARAEQRAAADQAIIQGLLGAAKSIPNWAQVAASLAAGGAMAALIMSKNPIPQYFVGRDGGRAEWAWTQEKGREVITDKNRNIKSIGSDSGAQLTWLDEGDKVYTASQSAKILKDLENVGTPNYQLIADRSMAVPIIINKTEDNSEKIIDGVGMQLERVFKKYDKIIPIEDEYGNIYHQTGGQYPIFRGKRRNKVVVKIEDNGRN